jgi:hypothetical protein
MTDLGTKRFEMINCEGVEVRNIGGFSPLQGPHDFLPVGLLVLLLPANLRLISYGMPEASPQLSNYAQNAGQ